MSYPEKHIPLFVHYKCILQSNIHIYVYIMVPAFPFILNYLFFNCISIDTSKKHIMYHKKGDIQIRRHKPLEGGIT